MELNLRKARALEAKIQSYLDTTDVLTTASVRVKGTIEEAIKTLEERRKVVLADLPVRDELLHLRYEIRREIEVKNESTGINELINKVVLIDALLKQAAIPLQARQEGIDFEDNFNYQVAQFNAPVTDRYDRRSLTYSSHVCTKEDIEAIQKKVKNLKKEKELLQDKIGEKNIVGKVTLTDSAVKLLESVGLL